MRLRRAPELSRPSIDQIMAEYRARQATGSFQGVQGSTQGINLNPMSGLTAPVGVQGQQSPLPSREHPWSTRQKKVIDEALQMSRSVDVERAKVIAEVMQADAMAQQATAMLEIATQLSYIAEYLGGKK